MVFKQTKSTFKYLNFRTFVASWIFLMSNFQNCRTVLVDDPDKEYPELQEKVATVPMGYRISIE